MFVVRAWANYTYNTDKEAMKVINLRQKGCIAIGLQPTAATVNMRAETRMQATVTDVIHCISCVLCNYPSYMQL